MDVRLAAISAYMLTAVYCVTDVRLAAISAYMLMAVYLCDGCEVCCCICLHAYGSLFV